VGLVAGGCAIAVTLTMGAFVLTLKPPGFSVSEHDEAGEGYGVSDRARREIPALYLSLYEQAARRYGLDWTILAGIGRIECDHGRDRDSSCTQEGAVNAAGAGGPAQFLASTWEQYGVDGDGDGVADRWDPSDAILTMANYLHASGAPGNYRRAIYAYNHADWYVAAVEHWAALYRGASSRLSGSDTGDSEAAAGELSSPPSAEFDTGGEEQDSPLPGVEGASPAPVELSDGARATLSPSDGHVALIPSQVPPVVQAMVMAGNELQDLRYGPAGHPDPRGAPNEDCSSTLNYVLYRSGVRPITEILHENPLAQSYVHWGLPGPGRWVTIYATTSPTDHVFVVIAGLRLDTSHDGTDTGPNRDQDGPRWRVFDRLPTWAHWSVRHPPGL
jgi:hypothetical protein